MSGDLNRRLDRLGDRFGAGGCDACRQWRTTVVEVGRWADLPDHPPPPHRCLACGQAIPRQTVVQIIAPEPECDENPEVAI